MSSVAEEASGGVGEGVRRADPGELCTCGRPAARVYLGGRFGDTGHCGLADGGAPVDGVCTFCGDTIDHAHYAAAERAAGRDSAVGDDVAQGGRCPLYRLRLADPLPEVHSESVRRYDPVTDRRERAEGRLRAELLEVLLAAGADYDGSYTLLPDVEGEPGEIGDLEDVVFDIGWCVRQAMGRDPHDPASFHEQAGHDAVAVLVLLLRARLDELGVDPNPLAGLGAEALVERAGGAQAWRDTVAHDRPLLVTRRVVRRALDPEAPSDIYRPWWG